MRTLLGSLAIALLLAALLPAPAAAVGGVCEPPVISGQAAICPGATVRLLATTSASYGEWTCQWYRDAQPIPGANDEELFITTPGDYQAVVYYPECISGPSIPFTVAASVCLANPAGLILDPAINAGQSNGNGVLEPGERILFGPSWFNPGASPVGLAANSTNLAGPAGADYTLLDGVADYGTIAPGNIGNCFSATEDCYELAISNPAARPAAHWDVTLDETPLNGDLPTVWKVHVGSSFADVPASHMFYPEIEKLFHSGVTVGCGPVAFCPEETGTRLQVGIFLARVLAGGEANIPMTTAVYDCSPGGNSLFADVPAGDPFCSHVNYLAATGATTGCEPGVFCAATRATRVQMAVLVARATAGGDSAIPLSYGPDPGTGLSYSCDPSAPNTHFSDVGSGDWFCRHAEYVRATGVASGYSDGTFQPARDITRGQMAKFLANGF
ncbi:MAG TPA: S-layer homology domain-containing protein, partial [Thermoanaerobaculia bacterium]|nr:S-layer homology domain-containing protein [Thermoanaerobaculia bacterium]